MVFILPAHRIPAPLLAAVILIACGMSTLAQAQQVTELSVQIESGRQLMLAGRYAEAESVFRATLTIAEQAREPVWKAIAFDSLGSLYENRGRYVDAEQMWQRSLLILERHEGAEAVTIALVRMELASLYLYTGRPSRAEPLLLRTLEVLANKPGAEIVLADAVGDLGCLYVATNRLAQAESLFHRALTFPRSTPEMRGAALTFSATWHLLQF